MESYFDLVIEFENIDGTFIGESRFLLSDKKSEIVDYLQEELLTCQDYCRFSDYTIYKWELDGDVTIGSRLRITFVINEYHDTFTAYLYKGADVLKSIECESTMIKRYYLVKIQE